MADIPAGVLVRQELDENGLPKVILIFDDKGHNIEASLSKAERAAFASGTDTLRIRLVTYQKVLGSKSDYVEIENLGNSESEKAVRIVRYYRQ